MSSKIAKALEYLKDGRWHTMEEMKEKMRLNEDQIQQIMKFLSAYNFVIINQEEKKVKLEEMIRKFLTQTTTSEVPSNLYKPSKKPCPFQ
ncbi:MAG: hypothetical protein QMD20_00490 [Candidatus Bathyarchaeia archaeon]|nr:hypothetical protein [Candidatus Bathyarchaeia archaeon]